MAIPGELVDDEGALLCPECGEKSWQVWYVEPAYQDVGVTVDANGELELEYGVGDHGHTDPLGCDEELRCLECEFVLTLAHAQYMTREVPGSEVADQLCKALEGRKQKAAAAEEEQGS